MFKYSRQPSSPTLYVLLPDLDPFLDPRLPFGCSETVRAGAKRSTARPRHQKGGAAQVKPTKLRSIPLQEVCQRQPLAGVQKLSLSVTACVTYRHQALSSIVPQSYLVITSDSGISFSGGPVVTSE
jgi:hypothetical protein